MSTYMSHSGKLREAVTALASLRPALAALTRATLARVVVVNEYSPNGTDYAGVAKAALPGAEFVQKGDAEQGQVKTLNFILEAIRGFDYWVHWEESWACTGNFLDDAIDVMESSAIDQLQVSADIWHNWGSDLLLPRVSPAGAIHAEVQPHPKFLQLFPTLNQDNLKDALETHGLEGIWPLYSLRPAVNRVARHEPLGEFPDLAAIRFEWEYGARWFRSGARKAILLPVAAVRQADHVSTWAKPPG